jgi:hypothetical protein
LLDIPVNVTRRTLGKAPWWQLRRTFAWRGRNYSYQSSTSLFSTPLDLYWNTADLGVKSQLWCCTVPGIACQSGPTAHQQSTRNSRTILSGRYQGRGSTPNMALSNDERGWVMTCLSGIGMFCLSHCATCALTPKSMCTRRLDHMYRPVSSTTAGETRLQNTGQRQLSFCFAEPELWCDGTGNHYLHSQKQVC